MSNGTVVAICIAAEAGAPMVHVQEVEAIAGAGLLGDRYCTPGEGSFKRRVAECQVTLINEEFFKDSGFNFLSVRRNIIAFGIELVRLINEDEFQIGEARMRALKYCYPCTRPNKLGGETLRDARPFDEVFFGKAGIIAEVTVGGIIRPGDFIIPPWSK